MPPHWLSEPVGVEILVDHSSGTYLFVDRVPQYSLRSCPNSKMASAIRSQNLYIGYLGTYGFIPDINVKTQLFFFSVVLKIERLLIHCRSYMHI